MSELTREEGSRGDPIVPPVGDSTMRLPRRDIQLSRFVVALRDLLHDADHFSLTVTWKNDARTELKSPEELLRASDSLGLVKHVSGYAAYPDEGYVHLRWDQAGYSSAFTASPGAALNAQRRFMHQVSLSPLRGVARRLVLSMRGPAILTTSILLGVAIRLEAWNVGVIARLLGVFAALTILLMPLGFFWPGRASAPRLVSDERSSRDIQWWAAVATIVAIPLAIVLFFASR